MAATDTTDSSPGSELFGTLCYWIAAPCEEAGPSARQASPSELARLHLDFLSDLPEHCRVQLFCRVQKFMSGINLMTPLKFIITVK
jgi:hypothetical protein